MGWLSRTGTRIARLELRDSWRRAWARAAIAALPVGALGALITWAVGGPWVYVALRCVLLTLFYLLFARLLIRLHARRPARRW